jgi:multidrug efflux pump subunit AcrA (membrane-fusion protein)
MQRDPQGKPKREKVYVQVGLRSASHAEILSGVREGDQVAKPPFVGPARRQFELREERRRE